jgi:hypothetical protein
MRRRGDVRLPEWIRLREIIPLDRAPSDCGQRPPEVVSVLRVPAGDARIRGRKVEQHERTRGFGQVQVSVAST